MRYQMRPGYCGPAAICNALRCFGVRVRQDIIAKHCETDSDGTDEEGMKKGLTALGFGFAEIKEAKYADAESQLVKHLPNGPTILLTESGDHWEVAIGLIGNHVVVIDSQNYKFNKAENGVHVVRRGRKLSEYWSQYKGHWQGLNVYYQPKPDSL